MPVRHPITDNFRVMTAFPLARSVTPIEGGTDGHIAQKVLETSPQSWAETDLKALFATGRPERNVDKGDKAGPISHRRGRVGAGDRRAGTAPATPATPDAKPDDAPKPETRVVVVGDSDFASNRALGIQGNRELFLNMANWLAQQENLIAIRPKRSRRPAAHDDRRSAAYGLLLHAVHRAAAALRQRHSRVVEAAIEAGQSDAWKADVRLLRRCSWSGRWAWRVHLLRRVQARPDRSRRPGRTRSSRSRPAKIEEVELALAERRHDAQEERRRPGRSWRRSTAAADEYDGQLARVRASRRSRCSGRSRTIPRRSASSASTRPESRVAFKVAGDATPAPPEHREQDTDRLRSVRAHRGPAEALPDRVAPRGHAQSFDVRPARQNRSSSSSGTRSTAIRIAPAGSPAVTLARNGADWRLTAPVDTRADSSAVDSLINRAVAGHVQGCGRGRTDAGVRRRPEEVRTRPSAIRSGARRRIDARVARHRQQARRQLGVRARRVEAGRS